MDNHFLTSLADGVGQNDAHADVPAAKSMGYRKTKTVLFNLAYRPDIQYTCAPVGAHVGVAIFHGNHAQVVQQHIKLNNPKKRNNNNFLI